METIDDDEARLITLFRMMNSVGRDKTLIGAADIRACRWEFIQFLMDADAEREKERSSQAEDDDSEG